jgi:hypothetical protein
MHRMASPMVAFPPVNTFAASHKGIEIIIQPMINTMIAISNCTRSMLQPQRPSTDRKSIRGPAIKTKVSCDLG